MSVRKKHSDKKRRFFRRLKRTFFSKKAAQGSITVFLTIIMLPMLIFSFSIVDLCKIFMGAQLTQSAEDVALNSAMTAYDKALKDMYGLLATSATEEELTDKITDYYIATLESSGISTDDKEGVKSLLSTLIGSDMPASLGQNDSFLRLFSTNVPNDTDPIKISPVATSSISNPSVMHRQIVEYMKYRGPVYLVSGTFDKLNAFKDLSNQTTATNAKLDFEETLSNINNDAIKAYVMFELYFANSDELETGNSHYNIPYPNEATASTLINMYSFDIVNDLHFSSFYKNGNFTIEDYVTRLINEVAFPAAAYSATASSYRNNGKLIYDENILKVFEPDLIGEEMYSESISDLTKQLSDKVEELQNNYSQFIPTGTTDCAFYDGLVELNKFANANQSVDYTTIVSGYDTVWAYAPLFEGVDSNRTDLDFANTLKEFADLYIKAVGQVKYAEKNGTGNEDTEQNNGDDSDTDGDDENGNTNESSQNEQEDLKKLVDEIQKGFAKNLKTGVNDLVIYVQNWHDDAEVAYSNICNVLNELYMATDYNFRMLTVLSSTLETIYRQFTTAQEQAETYSNAVNNIQTESVKAGFNAQYVNEAKDIKELNRQDLEELKEIVDKQKALYGNVFNMLTELKFFNKFLLADNRIYDIDVIMSDYVTQTNGFKGNLTYNGIWVTSVDQNYVDHIQTENIGKWNNSSIKTSITSNELYQKIKELGVPKEPQEKKEEVKNEVQQGNVKKNSDEILKKEGAATEDTSKEFNPNNYKTFSDYINEQNNGTSGGGTTFSGSLGTDENSDNNAIKQNASSLMSKVGNFFEKLAEAGRDKLYITEYLTENFTCLTTNKLDENKSEQMISGFKFYDSKNNKANVVWYGSELEYILYGQTSKEGNILAAGGTIFAIRFVLNLIYSFTDPEIRGFTMAAATAAAGLFPFAIPLVQAVLHICLSLAESSYDLMVLVDGGSVPIYKTQSTWVCKGSGVVREIGAEVIKEVSNLAIDKLSDDLCDKIEEYGSDLNDDVISSIQGFSDMVEEEVKNIREQVENDVMTPIYDVIQKAVSAYNNEKSQIEVMLRDTLESAKKDLGLSSGAKDNDIVKEIEIEMFDYLASQIGNIANIISQNIEKFQKAFLGISVEEVTNSASRGYAEIDEKFQALFDKIEEKITTSRDKIKKSVTNAIKSAVSTAQNGVKSTAKQLKSSIQSNLNRSLRGHEDYDINYGGKASVSAMLSMDYKDYLYLFTAIGLIVNENAMLQRAAILMSANVSKASGSTYDTNKAYTLIKATSASQVRTVFWGTYWDESGNRFVMPANSRYTIVKTSYMGY